MPPRIDSRYTFTSGYRDSAGRMLLTDRVRFLFQDLADNKQHIVKAGDTLWSLAARYFAPMDRADGFWWVIADFQPPDPIFDPTIALEPGTVLVIPSLRTLRENILSERRRFTDSV